MAKALTVADHKRQTLYWEGGHYELNLSFDTLRDKQWQRAMIAVWNHAAIHGPLAVRYTPGGEVPERIDVQAPPPTATLTQHGQLKVGEAVFGCDVQATRSLFECVSVLIPVNMFAGITGSPQIRQEFAELEGLDSVLYEIALQVYDTAPFKIAVVGYERGCQLPAELRGNADLRQALLHDGYALVQDDVLQSIDANVNSYEQVRANLRWLTPQGQSA